MSATSSRYIVLLDHHYAILHLSAVPLSTCYDYAALRQSSWLAMSSPMPMMHHAKDLVQGSSCVCAWAGDQALA